MIDPCGRVHLLGDDEGLGLEVQRNAGVSAGGRADASDIALGWFDARNRVHHGFQVFGSRAAAAADDAHAVVPDEMLVIVS